ncbi:MAG: alpha/beta fold hydrolase, partial [Bacteroidia bacterium]
MQVFIITAVILLILALPLILLRMISPGKTSPVRDAKGKLVSGSIAVIERVSIGGTEQAMIIRGHDVKNPVLLYLHGGPGTPEFAFIKKEFAELEKHFTICYWEQRGAGKSAKWKLPSEQVTLEQLVKDCGEVAVYLQQRFKTGRIYLLGHSWGTVLGAHSAKTYP